MESQKGKVYWITGLSGAGKTTIGTLLYERLRKEKPNVVLLDGDVLRQVFGDDLGYSREERMKSAKRNGGICKLLSDQGIDVVCCTICLYHFIHKWNRENIPGYKEIYIKVSKQILIQRNQKNLYKNGREVAGIDVEVEEPIQPDMTIINDGSEELKDIVERIVEEL